MKSLRNYEAKASQLTLRIIKNIIKIQIEKQIINFFFAKKIEI